MVDHNPNLKPWTRPKPNQQAAKGHIERPAEVANIAWQTRNAPPTDYEQKLGDAFEAIFTEGVTELDALVARLNELGLRTPSGAAWTVEAFQAEMQRLGY